MFHSWYARPFSPRVPVLVGLLCGLGFAVEAGVPLRIAVGALKEAPSACVAGAAELRDGPGLPPRLGAALTDSLRARGVESVADSTLAAWLRRLDATRFPDPRDYGRARDYIASTGAARLVYVNDLRVTPSCRLRFESALWSTDPLDRLATHADSASTPEQAAARLAEWLAPRLHPMPSTETP